MTTHFYNKLTSCSTIYDSCFGRNRLFLSWLLVSQSLFPSGCVPCMFKVWDVSCGKDEGLIDGATLLRCNNSKRQLRTGKLKLRLWARKEADGAFLTATPRKVPRHERGKLERLEKLMNKYERGLIQRVHWLNRLDFQGIEKIRERESIGSRNSHLYLLIDFCRLEHQVVFQESGANFCIPAPLWATNELATI